MKKVVVVLCITLIWVTLCSAAMLTLVIAESRVENLETTLMDGWVTVIMKWGNARGFTVAFIVATVLVAISIFLFRMQMHGSAWLRTPEPAPEELEP